MGSETRLDEAPRFRVRALGALAQKPGCPESSTQALSPERLQRLCHGECYNPGDERRRITRIEVVRIRPQRAPGEPVSSLTTSTLSPVPVLVMVSVTPGSSDPCGSVMLPTTLP